MLAPLSGMIAAGIDNVTSSGESHVRLWRWETDGIISSNNNDSTDAMAPPSAMQGESPVNTTITTMTNATTDTNTTRATGKEQQQPTTLTLPSWLLE